MTYQINEILEAVAAGSLDREIALYRVTAPRFAKMVMGFDDATLATAVAETARNEMQQGAIDAAKIETTYRANSKL